MAMARRLHRRETEQFYSSKRAPRKREAADRGRYECRLQSRKGRNGIQDRFLKNLNFLPISVMGKSGFDSGEESREGGSIGHCGLVMSGSNSDAPGTDVFSG